MITGLDSDKDSAGSVYSKLKLKSSKQKKSSLKLSWTKVKGAAKYVLYGNKCGTENKFMKIGTYTGKTKTLKKVIGKKVKKGTYYKFIVVALDRNNNVVSTSKVVHVATKGGKVTNPKKVKVKKGQTVTVKSKITKASRKLKLKTHRKVTYESSNSTIATVTSGGAIKGVTKGTCYVYAYAQNGISKKVKVVVK